MLSGTVAGDESGPRSFFLVSGAHDPGFPWGDGETFSDVLLAVARPGSDGYDRYCISRRALGGLELDVAGGKYRFFLRTGEDPSWSNRAISWLLYRMGY